MAIRIQDVFLVRGGLVEQFLRYDDILTDSQIEMCLQEERLRLGVSDGPLQLKGWSTPCSPELEQAIKAGTVAVGYNPKDKTDYLLGTYEKGGMVRVML